MKPYLEETTKEFKEESINILTLEKSDLFVMNNNLPLIDERKQKLFYILVCRLIYATCRNRNDLKLTTSFFAGYLLFCNEGNYCKLQ